MLDFLRWLFNHRDVPKDKTQTKDNTVRNRLRSVLIQDRLDLSPELMQETKRGIWDMGRPVSSPGVYSPRPGDRLAVALETPGGATNGVKPAEVNPALRVVDEGHCHLPAVEEPPPVRKGEKGLVQQGASSGTGGLIDLNLAPAEMLETLPGIGPVSAQAIVDYGEANGPFQLVEEIMRVSRIGPVTYKKVRAHVTVNPAR